MSLIDKIFGTATDKVFGTATADPTAEKGIDIETQGLTAGPNAWASVVIGGGGVGGAGSGYYSTSAGSLSGYLSSGKSLTPEESKELEELNREYNSKIKAAKLVEFKKVPAEMRQFVINTLEWSVHLAKINNVHVDKDARHNDLEYREASTKLFGGTMSFGGTSFGIDYTNFYNQIGIPNGVTAEDLKQAHVEATLEEEMLDE